MSIPLLHAVALAALLAPVVSHAGDGGKDADRPYVLRIEVGTSVPICEAGTIGGPAGPPQRRGPLDRDGLVHGEGPGHQGAQAGDDALLGARLGRAGDASDLSR